MDTHGFASLAHVRILLVPVGLIPQASFDSYAEEIRSYESLKLAEIPSETKDGKGLRPCRPSIENHLTEFSRPISIKPLVQGKYTPQLSNAPASSVACLSIPSSTVAFPISSHWCRNLFHI